MKMRIERIQGDFTVCKVEADANRNKDWLANLCESGYCFIGKTDEEFSLICQAEDTPLSVTDREDDWHMFRIKETLNFQMIGVLAKIATLLAEINIPILAVSTFNTDYILVKKENEMMALSRLAANGYQILE